MAKFILNDGKFLKINNKFVIKTGSAPVELDGVCFTAKAAGSKISMSVTGTPTLGQNFQYSSDKIHWTEFNLGTTNDTATVITLEKVGDKVYFKGNNPNGVCESESKYFSFVMTGTILASGNIMNLIDNGKGESLVIPNNYCFYNLFFNCPIETSPTLPATTLKDSCYEYMFALCTSLKAAPALPATNLKKRCYRGMFNSNVYLTSVPTLAATQLQESCYEAMFRGCNSLTRTPLLPATTMVKNCYRYMFDKCRALQTMPVLPATTLAYGCYEGMLSECDLYETKNLSATVLADRCYYDMFKQCVNLLVAPDLPATTLAPYCYYGMFEGCRRLTSTPIISASILSSHCCQRMFYDCIALTSACDLLSSELAESCYASMFNGCSTLQNAPYMYFDQVASYACWEMFSGCSGLNYVKLAYTGNFDATDSGWSRLWLSGVATAGDFYYNGLDTSRGDSYIPVDWTVHSEQPTTYVLTIDSKEELQGEAVDETDAYIEAGYDTFTMDSEGYTSRDLPCEYSDLSYFMFQPYNTRSASARIVSGSGYYCVDSTRIYFTAGDTISNWTDDYKIYLTSDTHIVLQYKSLPFNIMKNFQNVMYDDVPNQMYSSESGTYTVQPMEGYSLPQSIEVDGDCRWYWSPNQESHQLSLSMVKEDITITINCEAPMGYNITGNLQNVFCPDLPAIMQPGEQRLFMVTADMGYTLPDQINVYGQYDQYDWKKESGELFISKPQSDMIIEIVGQPQ